MQKRLVLAASFIASLAAACPASADMGIVATSWPVSEAATDLPKLYCYHDMVFACDTERPRCTVNEAHWAAVEVDLPQKTITTMVGSPEPRKARVWSGIEGTKGNGRGRLTVEVDSMTVVIDASDLNSERESITFAWTFAERPGELQSWYGQCERSPRS